LIFLLYLFSRHQLVLRQGAATAGTFARDSRGRAGFRRNNRAYSPEGTRLHETEQSSQRTPGVAPTKSRARRRWDRCLPIPNDMLFHALAPGQHPNKLE
jgi:hypothetical protein